MTAAKHFPVLDGLRAVAILLVIPHNISVLSGHVPAFAYPLALLANVGWIGVQLFFALSGFLISGYLLDTRTATNYYGAFFGRRVLRIFPLYYGTLIALLLIVPLTGHAPAKLSETLHDQFWLWVFLSNWAASFGIGVDGFPHFWSLAIEEQFYLVWPFLVHDRAPAQLLRLCLAIIVATLLVRTALMLAGASHGVLYMFTICRMDALAAGAAAAALLRMPGTREWIRQRAGLLTASAALLLLAGAVLTRAYAFESPATQTYGYTILAIGFGAIVGLGALPPPGGFAGLWRVMSSAPLAAVGRYSYAMYVFHMPLHVFVGLPLLHRYLPEVTASMAIAYIVGATLCTFMLAFLSYRFFESPFLRLKHRFEPRAAAQESSP